MSATGDDLLPDLPGQRPAIVHLLRLGFRFEPALLWISLGTTVVGALPDALVAVWLGLIAEGLRTPGEPDRTLLLIAGIGIAFSCVGGWVVTSGSQRLHDRFRQRLAVALETHVARLQATTVGIEQHERPEVLDRLAMLRDQVFTLDHIFLSLFGLARHRHPASSS
jgi:ATP-binding cassette subfamily B protein